ncbi:hypothetical protein [Novimethylophilus kurashikiensis]|uniref:hypothetical protein n=1 Tax=Novimethylophilus kurashikiensis TaxID=1825523 RepID=UPI0011B211F4|nr:hypothetical protein [Novimethylophilus kurashikiensis]
MSEPASHSTNALVYMTWAFLFGVTIAGIYADGDLVFGRIRHDRQADLVGRSCKYIGDVRVAPVQRFVPSIVGAPGSGIEIKATFRRFECPDGTVTLIPLSDMKNGH